MRALPVLIACALLAGCDYTVPLAKTPELPIDAGVVGLWQEPKAKGDADRLLVLPLSKREYLVSYPAQSGDALFARACLCRCAGRTLVQLEWIGSAKGKLPEGDRRFQFVAYSATGETLTVRLLNADLVNKDAKSSEELARAIAENAGKPNAFREDMVFHKATD